MLNEEAAENNALSAPPQRRRLKYIDSLKGFAILCVVLGHVTDGYLSAGMYPSSKSMPIVHEVLYSFHMALFMIWRISTKAESLKKAACTDRR